MRKQVEIQMTEKDWELFWGLVIKSEEGECWDWLGHKNNYGYAIYLLNGKHYRTSRVILTKKLGRQILSGFFACHTCDNPACCNPEHLYEGDQKQNMQEMSRKGRQVFQKNPEKAARGERNGMYTHPESRARGLRHGRHTKPERTARGDRAGRRLHPEKYPIRENHGMAKLTQVQVNEIRNLYASRKYIQRELGAMFGVGQRTISKIVNYFLWKD